MSNSNNMKEGSQVNKLDPHPDFEELLKAERSRVEPTKKEPEVKKDLDPLGDYEPDLDLDEETFEFDTEDPSGESIDLPQNKKTEDFADLNNDIASFSRDGNDEEVKHSLDDSMEFNFDDTSSPSAGPEVSPQSTMKKEVVKKSSGLVFYVVIAVVVVVCGGVLYSLMHKKSPAPQSKSSMTQVATGFKSVLPEVHALPQTLPPAVPQSLQPVTTSTMTNGSDEQILSDTVANPAPGGAGAPVTMLQVNRQQLLGLLSNFQKVVADNEKSLSEQISSLKASLSAITAADSQMSQSMSGQFEQMSTQVSQVNQKLEAYNQSISGVQTALEKTQQQLKLILAQRAEDIDHYTLRAIVPGRAWLVDGQGQTVTIILNQELKNYGTVEEINDKMGYVTMSSGYVFK
jgi:hypothetical protein